MTNTPPPAAFQRHLDDIVNGTYRDTNPTWAYMHKAHGDLVSAFRKQPKNANCSPKLLAALKTVLSGMKAAKKGGTWKAADASPNSKPLPKRSHLAPAPPKRTTRNIPLTEQTLVAADEQMWVPTDDGHMRPAPIVEFEDLTTESNGLCVIDQAQLGRYLNDTYKDQPFSQACAMLCRESLYHNLISKSNKWPAERFPFQRCDMYFAHKNGPPMLEKCLLIQLCHDEHVCYQDRTELREVSGELADSVKLSVQVLNHDGHADFNKNVKAQLGKAALAAVGGFKLLYGDTTPFWARALTDIEWKGKQIERHDGFATVAIQHYEDALP